MKALFDEVSFSCSKVITKSYSTSFSTATRLLSPKIRSAIYNIYGFVRIADEIVDSFDGFDQKELLDELKKQYVESKNSGISINPILNAFIQTVNSYSIEDKLVDSFLDSMYADLKVSNYTTKEAYDQYIYGSADVVGLMCLKVFVNGDELLYQKLRQPAMRLGSAFQKVNFLRDIKDDFELLNRSYFPNVNLGSLDQNSKNQIIKEIESDFNYAFVNGILKLPIEAKFGVYIAYAYYKRLLKKLKQIPSKELLETRIRVSNSTKISILAKSYVKFKLNLF